MCGRTWREHVSGRIALAMLLWCVACFNWVAPVSAQTTLNAVKAKGFLTCGVNQKLYGFSMVSENGQWSGFEIDFCRAVAAAIFDDPTKVQFVPLLAAERFQTLKSGKIDILMRGSSAFLSREAGGGFDFPAITYFDGQGVLVPRERGHSSIKELNGTTFCLQQGATGEANLTDFARMNDFTYKTKFFASTGEAFKAYEAGQCDALTADTSVLYAERAMAPHGEEHMLLPDVISKEPVGPVVRTGDRQWFLIVRWVHMAMLDGEELGVGAATVESAWKSENTAIRRLIGLEGDHGPSLGLSRDWSYRILRRVGNYGEVFERNIGEGSLLKIKRGHNALWTKGGLQYGLPIR